jgi:hypothetical protein
MSARIARVRLFRPVTCALLIAGLLLGLASSHGVSAQQPTPTPSAPQGAATPTEGDVATQLRVEAPEGPFSTGEQFDVQLLIENVEHLAGFDVFIDYDHTQLRLVSGQMEPFFLEGEREPQCGDSPNGWVELSGNTSQIESDLSAVRGAVIQSNPPEDTVTAWFPATETDQALEAGQVERTRVFINCFSVGPPVSLGGAPGVSGSGQLATVSFEALGDGTAELPVSQSGLLLDEIDPPADPDGQVVMIPHDPQGASVELEGDGGGSSWFVIAVGALVLLLIVLIQVIPAWIICGKLGWARPLSLLSILPIIGLIFLLMLTWEALPRAGQSRWLMLLLLFPLLGLIMLFWLAFAGWKSQPGAPAVSGGAPP